MLTDPLACSERERDRRMEAAGKKTKLTRDRDRDISEKIALGMAPRGAAAEAQYDERLFNQSAGLGSGFGAEDCAFYLFLACVPLHL